MMKLTKINDISCKKINLPKIDSKTIKGYDILNDKLYPNIFCVGKSGSGKTSLLFEFIKNVIDKNTKVYFFVATFFNDDSYDVIREYLDKKEIEYEGYEEIGNVIKDFSKEREEFMKREKMNKKEDVESVEPLTMSEAIKIIFEGENVKIKVKKPKKLTPKYLFVFDDMSSDLRKKDVTIFMKNRRHYKTCNWIASQNVMDLDGHARANLNIMILFEGITLEKLLQFYESANLWVDFDVFKSVYDFATTNEIGEHNFLFINKDIREFRRNFNNKISF